MGKIVGFSEDWYLFVALLAGLLGSVVLAKYVPMTLAIGWGSTGASVALAALLFRCMTFSIATRAALLFLFALAFILSVRWLSTPVVP